MISEKLQLKFWILTSAAFELWRKANQKERNRITKNLGKYQAKEILKEIEKEVEIIMTKKDHQRIE